MAAHAPLCVSVTDLHVIVTVLTFLPFRLKSPIWIQEKVKAGCVCTAKIMPARAAPRNLRPGSPAMAPHTPQRLSVTDLHVILTVLTFPPFKLKLPIWILEKVKADCVCTAKIMPAPAAPRNLRPGSQAMATHTAQRHSVTDLHVM